MKKLTLTLACAAVCTLSSAAGISSVAMRHHPQATAITRNMPAAKLSPPDIISVAPLTEFNVPTGEYKSLGTGSMTDDMVTGWYQYQPVTYPVEIQQSVENPNYYRVIAPYGPAFAEAMLKTNNVTLKADQYDSESKYVWDIDVTNPDDVYFPKTMIGCNFGSGPMYIGIPTSASITFKDGVFTAPMRGVAVGDDSGAVAMNMHMAFRLVLPGVTAPDYNISLTGINACTTSRTISGDLFTGADVAMVKWTVLPNFMEDEMKSAVTEITKSGPEFTPRGKFSYEMDPVNKETIILVAFAQDGTQVGYTWQTYYYLGNEDADQWVDAGTATFTDGAIKSLYKINDYTMQCPLQRNKEHPDYLRLVNPYATHYAVQDRYYHNDHDHYIYIDAEDPACIYILESPIGFDFGNGACRVWSAVGYYMAAGFSFEECKELEQGAILADDNSFEFQDECILFSALGYDNGDWYMTDAGTKVQLPKDFVFGTLGVSDIAADNPADNDAPVEYYNLQGQRLSAPAAGITIRRQGSQITKIIR